MSVATTAEGASASDTKAATVENTASLANEPRGSVEPIAARAATAFRAGQYASALKGYRRALTLARRGADAATLRMNVAACLLKLKRLDEAMSEFLKVAEQEPSLAKQARLNAALVAVELERLDEAQALLDAASPVDESLSSRADEVRRRILQRRSTIETSSLQAYLATAAIQLSREQPQAAKVTLRAAVAEFPDDPELHYALGRAHQGLDETAEARSEYRRALALGLKEPLASSASHRLGAIDPLEPSEWFGWLSIAGGYDSNPRQSGVATETTLGRRGRGGSAYGRVSLELGRSQRISEQFSLRTRYAGEWLGLQKDDVQDLSLQNHGLFGGLQWAASERLTLGFELGPSVTYVGLSPIPQFTWDLLASLKLRYRVSALRSWRLGLDVRQITGLSDWGFLGGTRLDAELSHQWSCASGNLRLGMRARHLAIGTRRLSVDAAAIPACINCNGAEYVIPLSYTGIGPVASLRLRVAPTMHLLSSTQLDGRRYSDASYVVGFEASRKRRLDLRWTTGVDLQWALLENEQLLLVPSYALLVSTSNVAQSSEPSHAFDYDDRRFTQHFAELGLEGSF